MIKVPDDTLKHFDTPCHILNWYDSPLMYTFNDNDDIGKIKLAWACGRGNLHLTDNYLVLDTNFKQLAEFDEDNEPGCYQRFIQKGIENTNLVYLMKWVAVNGTMTYECYVLNPNEALEYLKQ